MEGLPGLAKIGRERTLDRWNYGLGPIAETYSPKQPAVWDGPSGNLDDSISISGRFSDEETDQEMLMRWRLIADATRVKVAHLHEQRPDESSAEAGPEDEQVGGSVQ